MNGAFGVSSPNASRNQPQAGAQRLGHQRQAGHHRGGGLMSEPSSWREPVGVALHHGRVRITRAQQPAERRVELDQHEPRRIDAVLDERLGDRPVPGPSSMTGPSLSGSTCCAMVRASSLPDGLTAPIASGFSSQDRMNCDLVVEAALRLARPRSCRSICFSSGTAVNSNRRIGPSNRSSNLSPGNPIAAR